MDAATALKTLTSSCSIIDLKYEHGEAVLFLPEPASDYKLNIKKPPQDIYVIRYNRFPDTNRFFCGGNLECKRADYILISDTDSTICILELKRSNKSATCQEIIAQLKGAKCIIDYFESAADAFLNQKDILKGYTLRCFIYQVTTRKRSFYNKSSENNDSPEKFNIFITVWFIIKN